MNKPLETKPVVAILGHANHGKTSIIDYLKKTTKVDEEFNSITQYIGAYEVSIKTPNGKRYITFIDTPGHASFARMREDSISIADIAILIIACDDGIQNQTKEAMEVIKKNNLPYIVVFSKVDKIDSTTLEKTKLSVLEHNILLEGLGGDIPFVTTSSKTGEGINTLLDTILLLYDIQDKKQEAIAGVILEVGIDSKRGIYADIIVKSLGINSGDFLTTSNCLATTRIMINSDGDNIKEASSGTAIRVYGFNNPPKIGDIITKHKSKKDAEKHLSSLPETDKNRQKKLGENTLPLIIKADAIGVLYAIEKEIIKLNVEEQLIEVIRKGLGAVSDSDVKNARSINRNTIIMAFNTKIDSNTLEYASRQSIQIISYKSIYEVTDWLKAYLQKNTKEELQQKGTADVIQCFITQRNYQVFGSRIKNGEFSVGDKVVIERSDKKITDGSIQNIEQNNEKKNSVSGEKTEFAIRVNTTQPIQIGDTIKSFA